MNIQLPEWGVVVGLLCFSLAMAGFVGAIYSRIGKVEQTIEDKLDGAFTEVCENVKGIKLETALQKVDIAVLRTDVSTLRIDVPVLRQGVGELKEHVAVLVSKWNKDK